MAEYIDREKMLKYIEENNTADEWIVGQYNADWIYSFIESQPTADVVEVKHGEWKHKRATIDGEHYFCCSECGREVSVNIYDNPSVTRFYPYCHCGAKMDGRRDT